jgi:hypothetical protein
MLLFLNLQDMHNILERGKTQIKVTEGLGKTFLDLLEH